MNENHSHTVGLDSLDRFRKHFAASLTTPWPYGSSRSLVFLSIFCLSADTITAAAAAAVL